MCEPFKLELVSHCWRYSRLLLLQASSLILHPPDPAKLSIIHTIFYSREDAETVAMLHWLQRQQWPASVKWRHWPIETERLLRRAIGRNEACHDTKADWIWLADVDYLFGPGCLDALPEQLANVAGPLAYPRYAMRSPTDPAGDELIESVLLPPDSADGDGSRIDGCDCRLRDVDYAAGEIETTRRAIGGVQIYRGDVARDRGYLSDSPRWHRPADRWRRTYEDRAFRGWLGDGNGEVRGEPVELPNLYRVRHSKRGRFDIGVRL